MKKGNKKSIISLIILVLCMALSTVFIARTVVRRVDINKNLENFVIAEIPEAEIIEIGNYYRESFVKNRSFGSSSGFSGSIYDKQDHEEVMHSARSVTGIRTISATLADGRTVELDINIKLSSGVAKLAIVTEDKIIDCVGIEGEASFKYTVTEANKVFVKILCEDAKIETVVIRKILSLDAA